MNVIMFVVGLVLMFALMIKTKYGPFICMLIAGLFIGLTSGLGTKGTIDGLVGGFGGTCKSIGLLVIFGTILGEYLEKSNACQKIATTLLKYTGNKNASAALSITGFIVAIPVFSDVAMVLLSPIVKNVGKKSGKNACALGTATACSPAVHQCLCGSYAGTFGRSGHPGIGYRGLHCLWSGLCCGDHPGGVGLHGILSAEETGQLVHGTAGGRSGIWRRK